MFVYKEDFEKFVDALQGTVDHIKQELIPDFDFSQYTDEHSTETFIEGEPVVKKAVEAKAAEAFSNEVKVEQAIEEPEDAFSTSELKWE